jgi:hypothetical protein
MATNTTPGFPPARRDPRQLSNTLRRTLNFNDSDAAAALFANSLPQGAFITDVKIEIATAFNAATTNQITVGTTTSTNTNIVATADVAANTTGVSNVTRGWGRSLTITADTPVYAVYAQSGTTATAGQAVIVITFEGGWAS